MAVISGAAISFEFSGGLEIGLKYNFGYNEIGDVNTSPGIGAKIKVDVAFLDLILTATRPLINSLIAKAEATPAQTRTKLNFEFDYIMEEIVDKEYMEMQFDHIVTELIKQGYDEQRIIKLVLKISTKRRLYE